MVVIPIKTLVRSILVRNELETKRRKHTIAQTMRLLRLGLLLSSSCIVVMSWEWAAVVSCVVVAVVRIVVTVSCVVNVVVERERADVAVCDERFLFGMWCTRDQMVRAQP